MTPKRWEQISQVYQAALEREANQRAAFLDQACAGDQDLRREVESLVAYQEQAESFLSSPALEGAARGIGADPASLPVPGDISHYQILSRLGEGGMGVVYKARDKDLGRSVALKVLAAGLVADPEHRRRLVLEARMASALNHPNILTVHEIASDQGIDFIVMEYVAGKTLDELIPRRGLPLKEALTYAIQIADGLATAHAAGIIHRDLKPGNLMVSQSGLVKVLDFGLAKLAVAAGSQGSDLTTMPVPSGIAKTEEGTLLGTVSYMSPEQAEGKNVDARSDIFSFGLVLYEMVTGQRAFTGQSNLAILTAILREEPKPASQIVKGVPHDLEKIISRCLRKERERRSQTMADVKIALQEVKEELDSEAHLTLPAPPPSRRRRLIRFALALALLAGGGIAVWFSRSATRVAETPLTAVPLTSYPGVEGQPCFSPGGDQVAFSWNGEKQDNFDIYVKLIGSGTQLRLTTAPEQDIHPSGFLISPLGPPERKVAEISQAGIFWRGLAWAPDGKSLVVTDRNSDNEPLGLFLLSVESGERRRLTLEKKLVDSDPAFSPDGSTLAFIREVGIGVSDIYLLALSEDFQPIGEPKRLTFENRYMSRPAWTPDGREIIFSSGTYLGPNLFRIPASGSGKPQRLTAFGEGGSEGAISRRGLRLVFTRELFDVNIWRVEVPGSHGKKIPPTRLISSTRADGEAQFSPDGKRIAFDSDRTGSTEIWVCDSDGSNAQQLTSLGTATTGSPRWSPDGEHIAFDSTVDGQCDIYVISANGGKPKRFTNRPASEVPSWSRDGKWIYFASNRSGERQAWKMPAGGGEAIQMTRKGGLEAFESPDSQWVYYTKSLDVSSLWKVPRDGGEETQVLESVDQQAFAIVNEGIYFIPTPDSAGRSSIQFFNFATKTTKPIATIEKPVFFYLSVSPDGRWILYSQIDQQGSDLMLVENFR